MEVGCWLPGGLCAAKVLPTMHLFLYCFSVKAFGDWLYFAARSGRQILGRMPSSIHNWKRNFIFVHSPTGWSFPTTWSAVDIRHKAFQAPNLVESELAEFDSLQVLDPPDLFQLDGLFKLIAKADKETSFFYIYHLLKFER
ncbi:hypothetical protein Taro_037772 [Colocasia esculenta]|uniref:Uncharacterized protein n=1 Tax=Colocasia esculenta TaxID=4460 RepID=A0A843WBY7_COLES|nr:hypothetical protein [Colocasia esculenta]